MKKLIVGLVVCAIPLAAAAETVDKAAINALWKGMGPCISFMRTKKVTDVDYWKYVESREEAVKIDPRVLTTEEKVSGKVPKEVIPICDKLVDDYAKGIGYEDDPVSSVCSGNITKRLDPIEKTYYAQFKADGAAHAKAWLARKDLEAARWYITSKEGFRTGGRTCEVNASLKKAFAPLKEKFDKTEALVKEIEQAKGVRFGGIRNNNFIVFIDLKTGKEVAKADDY